MTIEADPSTSSNDDTGSSSKDRQDAPEPTPAQNHRKRWKFQMRADDDDEEQDWWFASTAIPLIAATTGPLANVMSIAALVTSWRNNYDPANPGVDADSTGFKDPKWCLGLNGASLACGFIGNIFLLFNFTKAVRYIIALPMTIILWYFATGIVRMTFVRGAVFMRASNVGKLLVCEAKAEKTQRELADILCDYHATLLLSPCFQASSFY